MKIAVLSSQLPSPERAKTGGVAYAAHRLANALVQRGHELTVFSTDDRPDGALYHLCKVQSPRPSDPIRAWLWQWQLALRYAAQDFGEYDIIHAHGDHVFVRHPRTPLVRTMHGSSLAEALHSVSWKRRFWYLTFTPSEYVEAARATRVVAISANTRKYVPCVDLVIPNSVNRQVFRPDPHTNSQLRHRHPTILFVGTLAGRKRGRMMLEIFQNQIRPVLTNAELWMVAEQTVKAPGTVFFQTPDESTLAKLYRKSWVFCLPSTYEGFGIPYIEAMACGTPVVATPNEGARELLEDGKWGILAHPSELGETLLSILNYESRRCSLAALGLSRAEAFDQTRVVDKYESLFESMVDSKSLRRTGRGK